MLYLQYLFLLRYNVLLLVLFFAVVFLSQKGRTLAPMLGGMFELSPKRGGAVAMVGGMFTAFLILITQVILRSAPDRFGIPAAPDIAVLFVAIPALLVLFLLASRLIREALRPTRTAMFVFVGIFCAVLVTALGVFAKEYVSMPEIVLDLLRYSPEGYFDAHGVPVPEHITLIYVIAAYFLFYLAMGIWTGVRIKNNGNLPISALGWLLLLLLLLLLSLNGASFYLDRFHIALVPAMFLGAAAWSFLARKLIEPHTYRAFKIPDERRSEPRPTVRQALARAGDKAVIVCASGGGIHAGAWAAGLLGLLHEECPAFGRHLVLTSSVSGGSVGCLYYLTGLQNDPPPSAEHLFEASSASSLDHVAWGFGFRDLVRYLMPVGKIFRWGNRAWALERAWSRFEAFPVRRRVSEWESLVRQGKLPASVFNTTLVETGERCAVSTVDLIARADDPMLRSEFAHLYPGLEVPMSTAAGLSAAFPIVSPSSRIWVHPDEKAMPEVARRFHVTDGGFYDNYGVVSAIEFLQRGQKQLSAAGLPMPRVLVLRIMGHPDKPEPLKEREGFLFQILSPLKALLAMRSSSQAARNNVELDLLAGCLGPGNLKVLDFPYPEPDAPLTWHLTEGQKAELIHSLKSEDVSKKIGLVEAFLCETDS
jgi:hypothetical protein